MEIEEPLSEFITKPVSMECEAQENKLNEECQISLDKTIEVENSSLKSKDVSTNDSVEIICTQENPENGKKKVKEEKPPSKIVVRRLPPTMTKDQFLEQVSPLPEFDYIYYVQGDVNNNINPFSRGYLNFVNQEDLFSFSRTFDNYVFLDAKGQEYPAVVEFAMFQRVPKQRTKKKDPLMGTIESDPSFITFKENLLAEALENSKPGGKAIKQHYFETEISTTEEVNTTPLLEYLKVRRAEKARIREERREEKKRKELERKLKQKTKDKKVEGDEEESVKDMKVLPPKDRRDIKDRENKNTKRKDEKEKTKETRVRDYKTRGGKSYQEERLKLAERREEQKKRELHNTSEKRQDTGEVLDTSDTNDLNEQIKTTEEKSVKPERKRYDNRKGNKYENDDWKDDNKKRNRNEKSNSKRDGRDRKEEYSRRNIDKKANDSDLRRKAKMYKGSDPSKSDKKKTSSLHDEQENKHCSVNQEKTKKEVEIPEKKSRSIDDLSCILGVESYNSGIGIQPNLKRSKSLETSRPEKNIESFLISDIEKIILQKREKSLMKDSKQAENSSTFRSRKDLSNKKYMDNKMSLKNKERSHEKHEEMIEEQSSKNTHESGCGGDFTNKPKEVSRAERRIRNKDRPSIEIYRPGMGKFSKQRLEKEKALGSSTEVESPSHSPSPTPKTKLIS